MSRIARSLMVFVPLTCLCAAPVSWGKTVGIWKDGRSAITDGLLKTIDQFLVGRLFPGLQPGHQLQIFAPICV